MSSKRADPDAFAAVREECDHCDRQTRHDVAVELRTESKQSENAEFSREPYRVAECTVCGTETTTRMNNA
jgi:formate dehydrogenase assembly factor FdhD